jgi:hypothetical protein
MVINTSVGVQQSSSFHRLTFVHYPQTTHTSFKITTLHLVQSDYQLYANSIDFCQFWPARKLTSRCLFFGSGVTVHSARLSVALLSNFRYVYWYRSMISQVQVHFLCCILNVFCATISQSVCTSFASDIQSGVCSTLIRPHQNGNRIKSCAVT